MIIVSALASPLTGAIADSAQPGAVNYIQNGGFTAAAKNGIANWKQLSTANSVTTGTEGSDSYVSMVSSDEKSQTGLVQSVPLRGEWSRILLRGNIRVNFQDTAAPATPSTPQGGTPFIGVALDWLDKSGHVTQVSTAQSWLFSTPGWVEINQLFDVPPGTTSLIVTPEVADVKATAYFKDLSLAAWVSTFQDNFAGSTIDANRWGITTGKHDSGNNEAEWLTPNEVKVADNSMTITAEKKPLNGFAFQSGQISTINKFQQLYGIFEFRLKCPFTQGSWCAAYLLSSNDDWPPEIDVEEMSGSDGGVVLETNHYSDEYGRHRSSNVNYPPNGMDRTQWHTYAVVWEPGQLAYYVDGIYRGTTGQPYDDVSNVPMYITINLAVGAYGGDPSNSVWPQQFVCSNVAVYQRSDLPLPLYPEDSQEITLPHNTATLTAMACEPIDSFAKTWSLVDGPAPVKIVDPHSLTTKVKFTKPGMYKFSIHIAKGLDTNDAQYLVYVNSALGSH